MLHRESKQQTGAWGSQLIAAAMSLITVGCALSRPDIVIHESPRGSVFLERLPDRSLQAAHPITLDPGIIARVLRGVYVREEKTALQSLFTTRKETARVFSDEETEFLAPLIATALTQAVSDQQVGFLLNQIGAPTYSQREGAALGSSEPPLSLAPKEITSATLYAYGLSLHLTLTRYRHRPERADTINLQNRRLPDPIGLKDRDVLFIPEAARRPDSYQESGFLGSSDVTTLVVDYGLLATLPASQPAPAASSASHALPAAATSPAQPAEQAAPTTEELQSVKELIIKRDMELEALKEELRTLKRQIEEQGDPQKPKGKKKSVPNPQEASP